VASEAKFEAIHRAVELPLEQLRPSLTQQEAFYREVEGLRLQIGAMRDDLDAGDTDGMTKKELAADKRELERARKRLDAIERHGAKYIEKLQEGEPHAS
jgi:chromosome segregation ATPase